MWNKIIKNLFLPVKKFSFLVLSFVFAFIIFFGIVIVYAWTEPASVPPTGNVSAPVNVGATSQYKSGALGVGGVFHGYSTGLFDGNVGIGTSSPAYELDILGNVRWSGTLQGGSVPWARLTSFPSACPAGQYVTAIGGSLTCGALATSTSYWTASGNNIYNNNSGNVGIGTTPSYTLDVNGSIRLSGNGLYNSAGYQLIQGNATDWIRIGNAAFTNGAAIYNNIATNGGLSVGSWSKPEAGNAYIAGKVGIGVSDPSEKLDVMGYIKGQSGLCIGNDCRTSWPVALFPILFQPSSFTNLNEDSTHSQINQGWITHQILMTKHIGTKLKFKLHLVGDYDQHLKVRLCYGATVTNESVPEFALTTANCGTEIKNIGGAWTSTNRSPVSREGEANLTVPDNQYKYITLQTSIDGGSYYWGWLHYLIEE